LIKGKEICAKLTFLYMKERPLENFRILAGAIWGASVKDVKGDRLHEYRAHLRGESARYNQEEQVLKQMLFAQVTASLQRGNICLDELLTVPWSSRRIRLPRITAALIAFTNDHGKKTAPEFFPVDAIVTYLHSVRQQYEEIGQPLTIPDQFALALSQTNNNPIATALLAHGAYRAVARGWDTRMSAQLDFPVTSDTEAITMVSIAESTADFISSQGPLDTLGDTYHFWSQFSAGMVFTLEKRFIQSGLYTLAFSHAPELTTLIRETFGGKSQQFGVHKEPDMLGLRLGRATGHLIANTLGEQEQIVFLS